ncbi:MAG: hypothetical protein R6U50_06410 [Desulfobacterales bacterium]
MASAVVMAGYQNKREVKRYSKIVAENYGETFIETGYKPLREFRVEDGGVSVSKPLVQFTLELLLKIDNVKDIIVVGHQMLLEQRLGEFFKTSAKPIKVVNQNQKLAGQIAKQYNIEKKHVKFNSLAGNMIKGYAETDAAKTSEHALFVASDSPLTKIDFVRRFIELSSVFLDEYAVIVPAVLIGDDKMGRKPLRLKNDSGYPVKHSYTDAYGRYGFRLSSVLFGNPTRFDINTVNTAYNLRKFLNPKVQIRLFSITRSLGFANVYSKYFLRKDLSIRDCEQITSQFFRGPLKLIPMEGEESTYDYDGTDKEFRFIKQMLAKQAVSDHPISANSELKRTS